jgi:hypothetical protein
MSGDLTVFKHFISNTNGIGGSVCCSTILHKQQYAFSSSVLLSEKGQRMSLTYRSELTVCFKLRSYYLCSCNGTQHIIMNGHFRSLTRINTAPVPIVFICPLRRNQASSVKNVSFGLRTPSCTAHKNQLQECILVS